MRKNLFVLLFLLGISLDAFGQSAAISYLLPDIGTSGMNTYVEIIGPHDTIDNFGTPGVSLNNPGDNLRVICLHPEDSAKVRIGPLFVAWDGRMIATHFFVLPGVTPNSSDWTALQSEFRIPIQVLLNGRVSNVDTFYLVNPQPGINVTSASLLGSGGATGLRSRRGAMIVSGLTLSSAAPVAVSTRDCDPQTSGNQGFLPLILLSTGDIRVASGARLDASANGETAGMGGGGGGGVFSDLVDDTQDRPGGDGFVGGQGGDLLGGTGSGGVGNVRTHGGMSLNGVPGAMDVPGSTLHGDTHNEGCQGTGGGTGFCFGTSGQGSFTSKCTLTNTVGGYGGGSGAAECCCDPWRTKTSFGGSGGAFATAGTTSTSGAGFPYGNPEMIPVMGGSGGAGGNPWYGVAGHGGGGGGAIVLYAAHNAHVASIASIGADGGDQVYQTMNIYSGAGGAGSGGGVILGAKLQTELDSAFVQGGKGGKPEIHNPDGPQNVQDGGDGGAGRVRMDGLRTKEALVTNSASYFRGPTTDTSRYVPRTFVLKGTGNGNPIRIYIGGKTIPWQVAANVSGYSGNVWSATILLPGQDTIYFLVAAQQIPNPSRAQFNEDPDWVLSQAAANILLTTPDCIATVLMSPQQRPKAIVNTSVTFPLHVHFGGTFSADSLIALATYARYSLEFDPTLLLPTTIIPPTGWSVQSQNISSGRIDVKLGKISSTVKTLDSLGEVIFSVLSAAKKNTSIALLELNIQDSNWSVPYCVFTSEGGSWVMILDSVASGVSHAGQEDFFVSEVYPNPATRSANLEVRLAREGTAKFGVFDVLGREVVGLRANVKLHAGRNAVPLSLAGLANGVYLLRVETSGQLATRMLRIGNARTR
jgi:hypothetical protein